MILILDTETTGLPYNMDYPHTNTANWPNMLSVAWQAHHDENLYAQEAYIVAPRPRVVNTPGAMAVNKITPEVQQKEGIEMGVILDRLFHAMLQADVIVAHNVQFDKNIIACEFHRAGIIMPNREWFCAKEDIGNLLQLPPTPAQRKYRPEIEYKQPRLDELYQFLFGKPVPGREESHGAKQDAAACAACYWELKKRGHI